MTCSACFLIEARTYQQARDGIIHMLGPPPLITKWENTLLLYLMKTLPQLRLLSQMTLACVKLTHKISQYRRVEMD